MHALCQAAFIIGEAAYARWALELAEAIFPRFVRRSGSGGVVGVYWKMSTDLSRPLVPAMGLHDALDGFITFRQAHSAGRRLANADGTGISAGIESLSVLCRDKDWTTNDPLGLGGLLFDAYRLCRLSHQERFDDLPLLQQVTDACHAGLLAFLAGRHLSLPASYRLAFRELGLAIGLRALPMIADAVTKEASEFARAPALRRTIDRLLPYETLGRNIVDFWMPYAQDRNTSWNAHQDINDVMLVTALIPSGFLST